jgi:hypothetical protein
MVRRLALALLDLLLEGVRWVVRLALSGKDAALRLWDQTGLRELLFKVLDFLLADFRALERYLDRVRTRMKYRVFFDHLTTPMKERYRRLRRA